MHHSTIGRSVQTCEIGNEIRQQLAHQHAQDIPGVKKRSGLSSAGEDSTSNFVFIRDLNLS